MLPTSENINKEIKKKCKEALEKAPGSRDEHQLEAISAYLRKSKLLPVTMADQTRLILKLCQGSKLLTMERNTILFLQGQPACSYFFVFSGAIDIRLEKDPAMIEAIKRQYGEMTYQSLGASFLRSEFGDHMVRITENKGFGEEALLRNAPRAASALSMHKSEVIEISPGLYAETLKPFHYAQTRVVQTFPLLRNHVLCESFPDRILTEIAYKMREAKFSATEMICSQNDEIEDVVLVCTGEVNVVKQKCITQKEAVKKTLRPGFFIGALECLKGDTTFQFGYRAKTEVEGYTIAVQHFEILLKSNDVATKLLEIERLLFRTISTKPAKQPKELIAAIGNLDSIRDIGASEVNPPTKKLTKAHSFQSVFPRTSRKAAYSTDSLFANISRAVRETAHSTGSILEEERVPKQAPSLKPTLLDEEAVCCEIKKEFAIKLPPTLNVQSTKGKIFACPPVLERPSSPPTSQNGSLTSRTQKLSGKELLNLGKSMKTIKEDEQIPHHLFNELVQISKKVEENARAPNNELPQKSSPPPTDRANRTRTVSSPVQMLNNTILQPDSKMQLNSRPNSSTKSVQDARNKFLNFVQPAQIKSKQTLSENALHS